LLQYYPTQKQKRYNLEAYVRGIERISPQHAEVSLGALSVSTKALKYLQGLRLIKAFTMDKFDNYIKKNIDIFQLQN